MLLAERDLWTADVLYIEVEGYVDVVADPDEWDALVHSVVFAVEVHFPFDFAHVAFFVRNDQR